jgi:hypothetical protein
MITRHCSLKVIRKVEHLIVPQHLELEEHDHVFVSFANTRRRHRSVQRIILSKITAHTALYGVATHLSHGECSHGFLSEKSRDVNRV